MSGALPHLLIGSVVGLALAARAGDTLAITIREAPRRGALAGLHASAGGVLSDLAALGVLAVLVLAQPEVFRRTGAVAVAIGLAAGATLAFLGWRLMDHRVGGGLRRDRGEVLIRAYHADPVIDRSLAALASPSRHLFWWTAGVALLVRAAAAGRDGVCAFLTGYVVARVAWHAFVAARLASRSRELLLHSPSKAPRGQR